MASTGPTGPLDPYGTTGQTGASYINPPKALDMIMHNFINGSGDKSIIPVFLFVLLFKSVFLQLSNISGA